MRPPTLWHDVAAISLWTAVVGFGVAGVTLLTKHANSGAVLILFALILAAPASAASRHLDESRDRITDDRS